MGTSRKSQRRSVRLKGYDYSQAGVYFVTVCTRNKKHIFGEISSGIFITNRLGIVVQESWLWLEKKYSYVELDEWTLMPNHLHGIRLIHRNLAIDNSRRAGSRCTTRGHR